MGKREYLMDTYTENYKGCGAFYGCANAGHVFGAALIYVVVLISWTTAIIRPDSARSEAIFNRLRVSVETEIHGLDVSQHGGASYSEFQTTIFKYKDASGTEKSMEMRVRAGDAARFAMILSDVVLDRVTAVWSKIIPKVKVTSGTLLPSHTWKQWQSDVKM